MHGRVGVIGHFAFGHNLYAALRIPLCCITVPITAIYEKNRLYRLEPDDIGHDFAVWVSGYSQFAAQGNLFMETA